MRPRWMKLWPMNSSTALAPFRVALMVGKMEYEAGIGCQLKADSSLVLASLRSAADGSE